MAYPIQTPDDITVLIPAAGRVPEGLLALSNIACTALIPVAGRPVIYWTLNYLRGLGVRRFQIAVPQRGLFVEDFVSCTVGRDCDVSFVVPPAGPTGGLGATVASLLELVETPAALVVLGDTFFQFDDPEILEETRPVLLTGPVEESYRWCVVESDKDGNVTQLHDKKPGLTGNLNALIGVYYFPDAEQARKAARRATNIGGAENHRIELVSILNDLRAQTPMQTRKAGEWLDCGNPDRQAGSHVALLQKREFNELTIDRTLATITKRSRLKAKFFDEINYLRLLPKDIAVLFPRVIDHSLDWDNLSMTMEYYGYATLAEMFVYENLDPGVWERIFDHLAKIISTAFMKYRQPLEQDVMLDMYLVKVSKRLASLEGPPELQALKDSPGPVRINGKLCPSITMAWPQIERDVRRLSENRQGCIIHGDLCFSNILYDVRSQICKLVDPRGSFGKSGIIGDPRYDVAKLYHSVLGLYDFITSDLFHVNFKGKDLVLDVPARSQHRQILARFEKIFFPAYDRREILLLTALIFASIPALHYDKPARQAAMFATSLEMLEELYPVAESALSPPTSAIPFPAFAR